MLLILLSSHCCPAGSLLTAQALTMPVSAAMMASGGAVFSRERSLRRSRSTVAFALFSTQMLEQWVREMLVASSLEHDADEHTCR